MAATMAEDGTVTFSTGKTLNGYNGLFSVSANGYLYEGYDYAIWANEPKPGSVERRELAELMIERWAKFGGIDLTHLSS